MLIQNLVIELVIDAYFGLDEIGVNNSLTSFLSDLAKFYAGLRSVVEPTDNNFFQYSSVYLSNLY